MDESEALVPEEEVSDLKVHIKGRHDVVFSPRLYLFVMNATGKRRFPVPEMY